MLLISITKLRPAIYLLPSKKTLLCGYKNVYSPYPSINCIFSLNKAKCISNVRKPIGTKLCCKARRRIRYEVEEEDEDDENYGYNEEIAMLELYSQSARGEALLVTAMVDDQEVEVLIFKGFSSCLSYKTSSDPSRSVLPQRATIKLIDRIRGPFNPSNIEYIEKGLTWETFRSRFASNDE